MAGPNKEELMKAAVELTKVAGGLKWKSIVPGSEHTCGIASDDSLYCWGRNTAGQLGASSAWVVNAGVDSNVPVAVGK